MAMGEIHKLYPNPKDSLDEGIFFEFKKHYQEHKEEIFQTLIHNKQTTIITDTGQKIICSLQMFGTKPFAAPLYARTYHILLESDNNRFGCHIEHKLRPVTREKWAEGLYPSSWAVNSKKFPLYSKQPKELEVTEKVLHPKEISLA